MTVNNIKVLNRDRVCFLLKDPHWTFIWWEISPETMNQVKAEIGEEITKAKFTLRIHDIQAFQTSR